VHKRRLPGSGLHCRRTRATDRQSPGSSLNSFRRRHNSSLRRHVSSSRSPALSCCQNSRSAEAASSADRQIRLVMSGLLLVIGGDYSTEAARDNPQLEKKRVAGDGARHGMRCAYTVHRKDTKSVRNP
jgi:hypothetical protein